MQDPVSEKSITESRCSFNKLLKTPEYQSIISDDTQRNQLIELLKVKPKGSCLDLACGNGYVGFAIAEKHPDCFVTGLDIADEVIIENRKKLKNGR